MIYPTSEAVPQSPWLQQSVGEYFAAIVWQAKAATQSAPPVAPQSESVPDAVQVASTEPALTQLASTQPATQVAAKATSRLSLDMTVVQYFASFPWGDGSPAPTVNPAAPSKSAAEPTVEDLDRSLAELLACEPTSSAGGSTDVAASGDSGSLADFSDFF